MGPHPGEQVQLTDLGNNRTQPAEICELRGRKLRLLVRDAPAQRGLVKIEGRAWLALGEIAALEPGDPLAVIVDVEHTLLNTDDRARQRELWQR